MTDKESLELFAEIIQTDMEPGLDTPLAEIEEWDSMAMMAIIAHFDARYGKTVTFEELEKLATVGDVVRLAPDFCQ